MSKKEEIYHSPKSSRRRRWDVLSREKFEPSLANELENSERELSLVSNKLNLPKKKIEKSANKIKRTAIKNEINYFNEEGSADILSAKLSAIINDATQLSNEKSSESYMKSEHGDSLLSHSKERIPSAPPLTPEKTKKMKKKSKDKLIKSSPSLINSKITEHLKNMKEDIVENDKKNNTDINVSGLLICPTSTSTFKGNISTIYCERLNNFVLTKQSDLISIQKNELLTDITKLQSRKSHAIYLQSGFRTFSVFCQGLLSGVTLTHCLMIFLLENRKDIFFQEKQIEQLFYSLIFFLSSICLISSLDRYDLAGKGIFSEHGIRIPWSPFFYFISLTLTLIMIGSVDLIVNFDIYPEEMQLEKSKWFSWWKYMATTRTVFALLGWISLAGDPHTDALNNRISEEFQD